MLIQAISTIIKILRIALDIIGIAIKSTASTASFPSESLLPLRLKPTNQLPQKVRTSAASTTAAVAFHFHSPPETDRRRATSTAPNSPPPLDYLDSLQPHQHIQSFHDFSLLNLGHKKEHHGSFSFVY